MENIAPSLLKKIQDEFRNAFNKSEIISKLYAKVRDGTAAYAEVNEFAIEAGEILAKAYKENISSDILPDGRLYYNIAKQIIDPTMSNNYEMISDMAEQVQQSLNKEAGIGLKPIKPELNQSRIDGIINKVSDSKKFDEVAWVLYEPIINFSQSIVDDSIKANAEFHANAGLSPKIIRRVSGNCCEWCKALAGKYNYPDEVPKDVYRRHQRCRCTIEYFPRDGKVQNVHTKKWRNEEERDKIELRKKVGLSDRKITPEEREQLITDLENRELLKRKIRQGDISLELNTEKQLPHMEKTRMEGKSYFTIDMDELQRLLKESSGTGNIHVKASGQIKEVIELNRDIAIHVDLESGKEMKTNRITVHYSKKRTHIVPARRFVEDE